MTFLGHIVWALAFASLAQTVFAAPPAKVCDDIEHCVYILERHAPDSFDYTVLHTEFLGYGPKATRALVEVAAWMDDPKSSYALQMLSRGGFQLTPAEQRDLIEVWPRENVKAHAIVLGRMASPRVRAAAIDTLAHPDSEVRKQSRYLLSEVAKAGFKFPMRQGDYSKLLKAALNEPHPALIALLETYPPAQLRPAYARLLRSGDTAMTMAVYEKLYQADKANALKTLVGVIQDLKDGELPAAMSISEMLQRRNKSRPDQFYLKFAKDLTNDAKLGLAGRAVGYDVLINAELARPGKSVTAPRLLDSPLNRNVFQYIVSNGEHSDAYVNYLQHLTSENADPYIAVLGASLKKNPNPIFISKLGRFQTPLAKDIVVKALNHPSDYRMISAAMISAAKQKQTDLKPKISDLKSNHPISAVRVAGRVALKEFNQPNKKKSSEELLRSSYKMLFYPLRGAENKEEVYCKVDSVDFKTISRKMPYFKSVILNGRYAGRQNLTSAVELKTGWLAGYDLGEWGGGLLYYDYETEKPISLLDENVTAIIPTKATPLGQFPTSFWAVTGLSHTNLSRGSVYRVTQNPDGFQVNLHATLPGPAHSIAVNFDNSIEMDFVDREGMKRNPELKMAPYDYNPPLLLEVNGNIRRLCKKGVAKQTDSAL